jgi:hypothetical protein
MVMGLLKQSPQLAQVGVFVSSLKMVMCIIS